MTVPGPLTGFTVAITAARRRDELAASLTRRGARVVLAPAIRIVPLADDSELLAATRACLTGPLDAVVATTGIGFRGWMEAADGWGLGERLVEHLQPARLLARGPKARGAIRAAGLSGEWSPASESCSEVLAHLLEGELAGQRIAVQLHGEPLPDFVEALRAADAEVVEVPVYRWSPPDDIGPLRRLVEQIADHLVDAVAFTSAPAAASLLQTARDLDREPAVLAALGDQVMPVCVGPVTAAPLERAGVKTVQPDRARLGGLVRALVEDLPARTRRLTVAGHELEVRGHAALLDGEPYEIPPVPMALLRALARQPGRVLPRAALLAELPGDRTDEHAVEMALTRLRAAIGDPRVVQTVVKRGYRLAYDPGGQPGDDDPGGCATPAHDGSATPTPDRPRPRRTDPAAAAPVNHRR
jgi:uroporphyrinogen-III synthase